WIVDVVVKQREVRAIEIGVELKHSGPGHALAERPNSRNGQRRTFPVDILLNPFNIRPYVRVFDLRRGSSSIPGLRVRDAATDGKPPKVSARYFSFVF